MCLSVNRLDCTGQIMVRFLRTLNENSPNPEFLVTPEKLNSDGKSTLTMQKVHIEHAYTNGDIAILLTEIVLTTEILVKCNGMRNNFRTHARIQW